MFRLMPRMLRLMPLLKKWKRMTIEAFAARLKNRFVRTALLQIWLPGDVSIRTRNDTRLVPRTAGRVPCGWFPSV
jgi:hypothetical protein